MKMKPLCFGVLLGFVSCSASTSERPPIEPWFPGDPSLHWHSVGRSQEGRTLYAVEFGSGSETTLILGGFHGDEKLAVEVTLAFARELRWHGPLLEGRRVVVVPIVNPDGYVAGRRTNARGVDLNRNYPTEDWGGAGRRAGESPASEPETRTVLALIQRLRPSKIVSLHNPYRVNNYDGGQSRALAESMAQFNGYPSTPSIGYPTPGSFGTWAGKERGIAMVTLEIPPGAFPERWRENRWALVSAVRQLRFSTPE